MYQLTEYCREPERLRGRFVTVLSLVVAVFVAIAALLALPLQAQAQGQSDPPAVSANTPPSIVQLPNDPDTFNKFDQITVLVKFTRAVTVTGSPRIGLDIGGVRRNATYSSGVDKLLLFRYVVTADDLDADGVDIIANSLELNGGSITGVGGGGAAAVLDHTSQLVTDTRRPVDGINPTVTLFGNSSGYEHPDNLVAVILRFSEPVTGLTLDDFTVTNGTAVDLEEEDPAVPGTAYSFQVVHGGEGAVTVMLPIGAVQDAAGNGNSASAVLRIIVADPARVGVTPSTSNSPEGQPVRFLLFRSKDNGARTVRLEVSQDGDFLSGGTSFGATISTTPAEVSVEFPAGVLIHTLSLDTEDDYLDDADGSVTLTVLPDPTEIGYVAGAPHVATASVRDNDEAPDLYVYQAPVIPIPMGSSNEVQEGAAFRFTLVRSHDAGPQTLDVEISQQGDFLAASHPDGLTIPADGSIQVSFPAEVLTTTVILNTVDDSVTEDDGTVTLTVLPRPSDSLYPVLVQGTNTMTVRDNDLLPTVTIAADAASVLEGYSISFTITRTNAPGEHDRYMPVRVEVTENGGRLEAGTLLQQDVVFPAGQTTQSFSLQTANDTVAELDGNVTVRVLPPLPAADSPYIVGAPDTATVEVLDDEVPIVSVSAVVSTLTEGSDAEFRVSRIGSLRNSLTVGVNIFGHHKVMSPDTRVLAANTGPLPDATVTIDAGMTGAILTLGTESDLVNEGDGELRVSIKGNSAYGTDGNGTATVLVQDDDIPEVTLRWITPALTLQNNVWVGIMFEGEPIDWRVDCSGNTLAAGGRSRPRIPFDYVVNMNHPNPLLSHYDNEWNYRHPCADDPGADLFFAGNKAGRQRYTGPDNGTITFDLLPQTFEVRDGVYTRCYLDDFPGTPQDVRFCPKFTLGAVTSAQILVLNRNPVVTVEAIDEEVNEGEPARFKLTRIWAEDLIDPPDPTPDLETTIDFTSRAVGGYVTAPPSGQRVFVNGVAEIIVEIPTANDLLPGSGGSVTFEILPGLPETQVANVGGTYEVYEFLPGITPAGKSSRVATVRILDDDLFPLLSIADATAEEGDPVEFVVTLSGAHNQQVTVDWDTSDGTAEVTYDYAYDTSSGTLGFAPGETEKTISVNTFEDMIPELDKAFTLTLSNPVQATLPTPATATGTITNDDTLPVVSIRPDETPILEGNNPKFIVSRQGFTDDRLDVQISLAKDGSAQPNSTVAIPVGQYSATHTVNHADDSVVGVDHQYVATVLSSTNYSIGIPGSATVDLLDDDESRVLTVEAHPDLYTFADVGDVIDITYYVKNLGTVATRAPITAHTNLNGDFVLSADPLPVDANLPGNLDHWAVVTVSYTITAADVTTGYVHLSWYAEDGIVRSAQDDVLINHEGRIYRYTIQNPAASDPELDDEDQDLTLQIWRQDENREEHVVRLYTTNDTARQPEDYAAVDETITFSYKQRNSVTLTVNDDRLDEPDESFNVFLVDAATGDILYDYARIGIDDNDDPVEIYVTDTHGGGTNESWPALYGQPQVSVWLYWPGWEVHAEALSDGSGHPVELSYETVAGTATAGEDYIHVSGRLKYPYSASNRLQFEVPIIDDRIVEGAETFYIRFSDGQHVTIPAEFELYAITISDNDTTLSDRVDISVAPAEVAEADGPTTVTVTAGLNNAAFQTATDLTVRVAGGTATEGTDFTTVTDFTLTIPVGDVSGTASFTLTPVEDGLIENALETIAVTATTTVVGLAVAPSGGATLQLRDSDVRGVTIVPTAMALDEGNDDTYTVVLATQPTGVVTVTPAISAGNGISLVHPSLTFGANNWDRPKTVTVIASPDADAVDEQVTLSHTVSGADYGSVNAPDVVVAVTDDDTLSTAIVISASLISVTEGGGDKTILITADYDQAAPDEDTTVRVEVVAGTALPSEDFAAVAAFDVLIPTGSTRGTNTITLSPVNDDVDEDDETLSITGQVAADGVPVNGALPVTGATVTIEDDDSRGVVVNPMALTMEEGGEQSYTMLLTSAPSETTYMAITVPANADLRVSPSGFYLHSGNWNVAQTVRVISLGDTDVLDDTVVLTHAFSGGDYNGIAVDDVSVTITEQTSTAMSVEDVRGAEGSGSLGFVVILDQAISATATVQYRTVGMAGNNGVTAKPGDDYTDTSGTLTFTPGETRKTVPVTVLDNSLNESEEYFQLVLENPTNAELPQPTPAMRTVQGIIEDDDPLPVVSVVGSTVDGWSYGDETAGPLSYTVRLSAASGREATVDYATDDRTPGSRFPSLQTATATVDYDPESGTLTFLPGETVKSLTVMVNDDKISEDTEVFALELSNPRNAVLSNQGWGVIRDEDVRGLELTPSTLTLTEGTSGTYQVALSSQPTAAVAVTLTPGAGVTLDLSSLSFQTNTWSVPQTVTVTATEDADAADRVATITHSVDGGDYAGVSVDDMFVTIRDDETRGVVVSPEFVTVPEGGSATYTVVLTSQPTGNVTVTLSRSGSSDVTVSPSPLTFTTGDWSTAQTVTVSAVHDADAVNDVATASHVVSGADYETETAADVSVTVSDDETASTKVVLSVDPVAVAEDAGSSTITVTATLDHAPRTVNTVVTVTVGKADDTATEGTDYGQVGSLSLYIVAGATSGTVAFTLTPTDDDVDEADKALTVGGSVQGLTVSPAAVTIEDNDEEGVAISETELTILEGNTDTYTVVLTSQPTGNVTVTVNDPADNTDVTADPATLTFTTTDWNVAQTVTVTVAQDDDAADETATITHSVSGYGAVATADDVVVTVEDDAPDALTVSFGAASYSVKEEDDADTVDVAENQAEVTVVLDADPKRTVTVPVTWDGQDGATAADFSGVPESVVFSRGETEKAFTFSALTDDVVDDRESVKLTFGTLPTGVSAGTPAEAVVSIDDTTRKTLIQRINFTGTENESLTVAGEFKVRVHFLPSADGLLQEELEITGGTIVAYDFEARPVGDGTVNVWYVNVLPDQEASTVTVRVPADVVEGGNQAAEVTYDTSPPLIAEFTTNATEPVIDDFQVTVTFSHDVLAERDGQESGPWLFIPSSDLEITRGTYVSQVMVSGKVWRITVTPNAVPGVVTVTLPHERVATGVATEVWNAAASIEVKAGKRSVDFEQAAYTAVEGGTVEVKVTLDADPLNTVVIPLTVTDQGGAGADDYSGIPASRTLTFNAGDTEKTFTFSAVDDSIDDDGESVKFGIGTPLPNIVKRGSTSEATVSITDDDTAGVTVNPTEVTVTEGGTTTYTVVLDSQPVGDVTVTVNDPTDNTDVTADPASITFTPMDWNVAETVTVSAAQDGDAVDETATITHTAASTADPAYHEISVSDVAVILEDDAPDTVTVSFEQSTYAVAESDDTATTEVQENQVTVKVKLSADPERSVTIEITKAGQGGATSSDYSGVPENVTFNSGDTEKTFTFSATADEVDDDGESVKLTFGTLPTGVTEGTTKESVVFITDDDDPAVSVSFERGTYAVSESDDTSTTEVQENRVAVKVQLSADPERSVTILITEALQDGATSADYSGVPEEVTFNSGDTEKTITFSATHDAVDDDGESVKLGFGTLPTGVTAGTTSEAVVSITDDDGAGVTVAPTSLSVGEGGSDTYAVVLASQPTHDVVVTVNDPTDNTDVTAEPGTLTFTTLNWSTAQTVTVTAAEDAGSDDETGTVTHTVSSTDAKYSGISASSVAVSVTDDDDPAVSVSFERGTYAVSESDDTSTTEVQENRVAVKVQLSADPERSVTILITEALQDGATSADYSGVPEEVTFQSGDREKTITFSATHDAVDDDGESVKLGFGTLPTGVTAGTTNEAVVSITDDDGAGVTVAPTSLSVGEGGSDTYAVVLASQPTHDVVVTVNDPTDNTDVTAEPGTLTFTTLNWSTAQTVTVTAAEDAGSDDETATVTHTVSSTDAKYSGISASSVAVSVTDDDDPAVSVSFERGTYAVSESDDTSTTEVQENRVAVKVQLSADPERSVTIDITQAGQGGATSADYSGVPEEVTFNSGDTEKTFTFSATHDAVDDDGESVKLGFGTLPTGVTAGTTSEAVVSITDDDGAGVTVAPTSLSVGEGGSDTYAVVLASQPTHDVVVTVNDPTDNTDVTAEPGTLTFTTLNWSTAQTVTVTAAEDAGSDDETATVTHTVSSTDAKYSGISASSVAVSVTDDDDPAVSVSFERGTYAVSESDDTSTTEVQENRVAVKVQLSADPERSVTILITEALQDGATSADYSGVPEEVTFNSGDTEKTITFSATHDAVDDDGESVKLGFGTLPTGVTAGTTSEAVVSITDDDGAGVTVAPTSLSVGEGGSDTYAVVLASQPTHDVVVTVNDPTDNTDVTAEPGTLTFTTLNWSTAQTVTVTAAEDAGSDDETATVTHTVSSTDAKYSGISASSVAVSVTDDDDPAVSVSFERGTYAVSESDDTSTTEVQENRVAVKVQLSADPERSVTILITEALQDGATSADYSGVPEEVTFQSGDTEKTITFSATHDAVDDDGESVKLGFGTLPTGVTAGTTSEAVVSITDDDGAGVTVAPTSLSVGEGGSDTYAVVLASQPTHDVVVTVNDPTDNTDVTAEPGTLTFTTLNWSVAQTVTVTAAEDAGSDDETGTVTHTVSSTDAKYSGISASSVAVSVTDDEDPAVSVSFERGTYAVSESDDTSTTEVQENRVAVKVQLSADPERSVTIEITKAGQGGATSADYSGVPEEVTFQSGDTEKTFTFSATHDAVDDDGESVKLGFGTLPTGVTAGTTSEAVVSITDDDGAGVTVAPTSLSVGEGGSDTYAVVLASQPTHDVVVTVNDPTDNTDVTAEPGTLTFTTLNWSVAQTVTVTAAEDNDAADETATVTHTAASTDSAYIGISVDDVDVSVTDDDTANSAPEFSDPTATRSVDENTAEGQDVGAVLMATDADMDTLTYTLEGTDAASFDIVTISGSAQIRTKTGVAYNHESNSIYTVVVKVDDGNGGTDTVTVTITVGDVNEPPGRPEAPTVSATAGSTSSLDVSWTAPGNTGSAIGSYALRYREGSSGSWTNGPQNETGTSAAIGSLNAGTAYEVQVRATNDEGDGAWSPAGTGATNAPTVTISADKTSAVFREDGITYTLTRTGSTTAAMAVTVGLTQTKNFLAAADLTQTVTIDAGQSMKTFTVGASSFQGFAAGTKVESGTLTAAVQDGTDYDPGTPPSADVAIVIGAAVRIEQASYSVGEAGGSLAVKLIARTGTGAPQPASNSSNLLLSQTDGTATEADGDYTPNSVSYQFQPSDFSFIGGVWQTETTINVAILNDALDEDDETFILKLGYHQMSAEHTPLVDVDGNSCGTECQVTVTITDDDTAGVTVSKTELTVTEQDGIGDSYTVVLDTEPTSNVVVTVAGHASTEVTPNPTTLTFTPMNWETGQTVTVTAGDDADTVGDTVALSHSAASADTDYQGITIAGVSVTVNDNDTDTPQVMGVMVEPGNGQLVLEWNAVDNATGYRVQWKSGDEDYNTGDRQATVTSGMTTTYTIGGLSNGTEYTVRVIATRTGANDGLPSAEVKGTPAAPAVTVSFGQGAYTVLEGDDASTTEVQENRVAVKVKLSADPERSVTIPITKAPQGGATSADYSGVPEEVIFSSGDMEKIFTFAAVQDSVYDDGESVKLGFGTLPTGVTAGTINEAVVSITDDDNSQRLTSVQVSFAVYAHTVPEGSSVEVTVNLSDDPGRTVTIRLTRTLQDGASAADYSGVPYDVTFHSGDTEKSFTFSATQDSVQDDGESVKLTFDTLPDEVTAGTPAETTFFITEGVAVSFDMATYVATEGGPNAAVTVELSAPAPRQVDILLTADGLRGAIAADWSGVPEMLTFNAGDTSKTFTFVAVDDDVEDDGEMVELGFGVLPDGFAAGSLATALVTLMNDDRGPSDPVRNQCPNDSGERIILVAVGEIGEAGESDFWRVELDPGRFYVIEVLGSEGEPDIMGEVNPGGLTLSDPNLYAVWSGDGSEQIRRAGIRNRRRLLVERADDLSGFQQFEVRSFGENTGTYQIKVRVNNICVMNNGEAQYTYAGGPDGYVWDDPADASTQGKLSPHPLQNIQIQSVLGDNEDWYWDQVPDEDWFAIEGLKEDHEYTIDVWTMEKELLLKHQATRLKILGIYGSNGMEAPGTSSAGSGKKVSVTFQPQNAGTFYVSVGSEAPDRTGVYRIRISAVALQVSNATEADTLTAALEDIPANHDGSSAFTFRIAFSEEVNISRRSMKDHALAVTGGTVTDARRVDGRKDLWELTVEPAGTGPVSILVPQDRACTETGALCTADGRMLSMGLGQLVPGPAPATEAAQAVPNNPATGQPVITGTPQVGETLTADTSGISDLDGLQNAAFTYRWIASGSDIEGATGSSHTIAEEDEGLTIQVRVSFTDDAGNEETLTSAATEAAQAVPNNPATGQPVITGTPQVGETLTADTSGISDLDGLQNAAFTYRWIASGSDIEGATGSSHTIAEEDEGLTIQVRVSFTDDAGNEETLTSAATEAAQAVPNNPATGQPVITGTPQVGETLTADTSGISDLDGLQNAAFTYRWIASGSDIEGATGSSHTIAEEDEGLTIQVRVSFTDDAGNEETLTSAATEAVQAVPNNPATGQPVITGTPQVGETLTVDTSGISDAEGVDNAVFAHRWIAGGADIEGETGSSYTIAAEDEGLVIQVWVSFTDDGGNPETRTSAGTEAVQPLPNTPATGTPIITGTARVGETLTADTSGISDAEGVDNAVFAHRWIAGGADIEGETGSSYTIAAEDEGLVIQVWVSFTDDGGNPETLSSLATSPVEAGPPRNRSATGLPSIVGSARIESTLTVDTSGIADADGMQDVVFRYQWIAHDGRSHTSIDGATGSSYTLVESDEGKRIWILVIFTDNEGNTETLMSAPTATVAE